MKRSQPLPYRPKAIQPLGFFGQLKAHFLTGVSHWAGRRADEAIDRRKEKRFPDEVTVTHEGLAYTCSLSGEYCKREPGSSKH